MGALQRSAGARGLLARLDALLRRPVVRGGVLFVFGSTYLRFMPAFLGQPSEPSGGVWLWLQLATGLAVVLLAGAGWALMARRGWWRPWAVAGGIAGLAVPMVWWVAVQSLAGVPNVTGNVVLHVAGALLLLLFLLLAGRRSA